MRSLPISTFFPYTTLFRSSIGIIGTLWSASNGVNAITKAFNRAYNVEEDRSFIVARLIAILLTIAMIVVISVALLLPIFGEVIGGYLFSFICLSENFIVILYIVCCVFFLCSYRGC